MKLSNVSLKACCLFCLTALLPIAATAQYNFYTSPTFFANQTTYPQFDYRATYGNNSGQKSSSSPTQSSHTVESTSSTYFAKAKSRASLNNNPLPYKRDPVLSDKLREDFLTNFAKQTPDTAERMRSTTQKTDLVQLMAGFIQLQGLDSGSIENLWAIWHAQSWAIAHSKPLPTAQQYQAVAAQVRGRLDKPSYIKNMDDAGRQAFFEALVYPLFIQKSKYEGYLRDGKSQILSRMATDTQAGFKKMGLDLKNLQLTQRGLIPL
jgi:hypothetical protein